MSKKKSWVKYTPKQLKALKAVKPGSDNAFNKVKAFGKKWEKGEAGVISTWYRIHGGKHKTPKHKVVKTRTNQIAPMIFKGFEFTSPRVKVSKDEELAVQRGIDLAIKDGQLTTKRAIPIAKKYELRVRAYLKDAYPKNVFNLHKHPADKALMVLIQKS